MKGGRVPFLPLSTVLFPKTTLLVTLPSCFGVLVDSGDFSQPLLVTSLLTPASRGEIGSLPYGTLAEIRHVRRLPSEKRMMVILRGIIKVRIINEYFESLLESLPEVRFSPVPVPAEALAIERKKKLVQTFKRYTRLLGICAAFPSCFPRGEGFVNWIASAVHLLPAEKYFLLEAGDLNLRCDRLCRLLRFEILALKKTRSPRQARRDLLHRSGLSRQEGNGL